MQILKPAAFLLACLAVGAGLAVLSLAANVSTGWVGAIALAAWAFIARRRWMLIEATSGLEPGAPERILWLRTAGNALIVGHVAASVVLVGDALRLGNGNTLAIDSWTIALGQLAATFLFRRDEKERDERHAAIAARGIRTGYTALIVFLIVLLGWLAYAPPPERSALSHFVLANLMIVLILTSYGVMLLRQLIDYAIDTRQALAADRATP
ncbi:MAG: hypothetical protein QM773_03965 [Hyphomonadaceae bacterium]